MMKDEKEDAIKSKPSSIPERKSADLNGGSLIDLTADDENQSSGLPKASTYQVNLPVTPEGFQIRYVSSFVSLGS